VTRSGKPTWQPISALPLLVSAIAGMLEGTEEQHRLLLEARQRPYVLDDDTVARMRRVFGAQAEDHWLFEEQLRRWSGEQLTTDQRREVDRLTRELASLQEATRSVLALADELKDRTIESLLAKSDLQVGLEELARRRDDPME
jgi:ribosomal protein L16 Arg81 hydroxylase